MSNFTKHLKLVFRHKYYVFVNMAKCGRPIQGLLHDCSKFSLPEFGESIRYYQGSRSPIEAAKEAKGYSEAWMHHFHRNKHHSSYWVDCAFGVVTPVKMPYKYLIEHICDNVAAGMVYLGDSWNNESPLLYYLQKDKASFYHPHTRRFIESVYEAIRDVGWNAAASHLRMCRKDLQHEYEHLT